MVGLLSDPGVVHQEQGLGCCGGVFASPGDHARVGKVEDLEQLGQRVAEYGPVEGSAGTVLAVVVVVLGTGPNLRASQVPLQAAADGQHRVEQAFGIQTFAVHPPEKPVVGVAVELDGVGAGAESVGAREDEFAQQALGRPVLFDQPGGEVVEQFGV